MKKIVLLLLLASCSTAIETKLDTYFTNQFPSTGPGAAVLIMKDTAILFAKGYGLADLTTHAPITTATLFNVGSITKTFVSNGILMLQQQGKLSVEDSLIKYFPSFKNKALAQKIKIKHLLTHSSGLPDNREVNKDTVFYLTANDAQNWYPVTQTDTLEFEPGTNYHYSNPAFNGLALIIEQVSGQKWQDFITSNIFIPSGMNTSTITDGPHPQQGVSHAYVRVQLKWREDDFGEEPTFCAAGNGGVWSSVTELSQYEQALRRATFLSQPLIDESAAIKNFPGWSGEKAPFIGWSWFIGQTTDGLKTIGHTGSQGGFQANYVSIPEKKILFVILCNAPHDLESVTEQVMGWLKEEKYLDK